MLITFQTTGYIPTRTIDNIEFMSMRCIVIGAGITGLSASLELLKRGWDVVIIEAKDRMGGRIYTIPLKNTTLTVEGGAEFIHGEMPLTTTLLKDANVGWRAAAGNPYRIQDGQLQQQEFFDEEWSLLLQKLKQVRRDMSFADFLQQNFQSEKFSALRSRVKQFVEGYNAASIEEASALALRDEWSKDEDPTQFRPEGGYGNLVNILAREVASLGGDIRLAEVVEAIDWQSGRVNVRTRSGGTHEGSKALITVPIGVLQQSSIRIYPDLPEYFSAAKKIGFGSVVKFHLAFSQPFWEKNEARKMEDLGFLFSDQRVPTWWTQRPNPVPLLTGWLGGPAVNDLPREEEKLLNLAITSLSNLFSFPKNKLQDLLVASNVINWSADPFSCGAYSYVTLATPEAKNRLNTPVANTLYFAGEALDEGPNTGTVEAALSSANLATGKIASP